MAGAKRSQFSK